MELASALPQARGAALLIVFEDVAQFFQQLTLGKHILDPAPGGLAALAGGGGFRAPFGALQQWVEVVIFLGFTEKLIVDVEMFVFACAHSRRKALEINRIDRSRVHE